MCDAGGLLATPFETVDRAGDESVEHGRILDVAAEIDAVALVVGLPIDLAGDEGPAARNVRNEVRRLTKRVRRAGLAERLTVAVQDERLTTAEAHRSLDDAGHRGDRRDLIDQLAAARILQGWLDAGCPGLAATDR